jgi:mRNA interferase MazF
MRYANGLVLWADIPERKPEGHEINKSRPVVIVSHSELNEIRRTVVIVPLSSSGKSYPPLSVPFSSAGPSSVAVVDQVVAIDKRRLRDPQGMASREDLERLKAALRKVLDL